jgi:hypothetical protein
MNREQKLAWLFVIFAAVALAVSLVAVFLLYSEYGMPKALKGFYLIGLTGLSGIIFLFLCRKEKAKAISDERDKLIGKNADLAGFGAVYLLVILVSYVPIGIAPEASVPTQWFPYLFPLAVFCQILARSVAILVQYGCGGKQNE